LNLYKLIAPIIGEAIALVPDALELRKLKGVKEWQPRFRLPRGYDLYEADILEKELELMRGFFEDVKRMGACPTCDEHIANLERELNYLAEKAPAYMKAQLLRQELAEFLAKYKPEKPKTQA
jgi:hypothetical protein